MHGPGKAAGLNRATAILKEDHKQLRDGGPVACGRPACLSQVPDVNSYAVTPSSVGGLSLWFVCVCVGGVWVWVWVGYRVSCSPGWPLIHCFSPE